MPTITFNLKDLNQLAKKELSPEEFERLLEAAKAEEDAREGEEVTVGLNDTNLPYLWSVEGIARLARGLFGTETGLPKIQLGNKSREVKKDASVQNVRPAIATFVAEGPELTEEMLIQLIQLQEKVAESFGQRRKYVSIGLYPADKIEFPVTYKAVDPESIAFIPLEGEKEMSLKEILAEHPKGIKYAEHLKGYKKYPILTDAKNQVLSFPPIINSNTLGKLEPGDNKMFFDATGMRDKDVMLSANIFAYALAERGYTIHPVKCGEQTSPDLQPAELDFNPKLVRTILGLELSETRIKELLEMMRYEAGTKVKIPPYRGDVMHQADLVEDVGIAYGYHNFKPELMESYTKGEECPLTEFTTDIRVITAGLGYQEVFSAMLSSPEILYRKMEAPDNGTIQIEDYISENYSVVRTWLMPILMDMLSHNKHLDYPQKVFEQGLVTIKDGQIKDEEHLGVVSTHANADFTEIKATLQSLATAAGIKIEYEDHEHPTFIPGRCCRLKMSGQDIGIIGEIAPKVLRNWGLDLPACGAELNLTKIFEEKKKLL